MFTFDEILALAARTQDTLDKAMEAAFGAAIVTALLDHPGEPIVESELWVFERAYTAIVLPTIDLLYSKEHVRGDDLHEFLMGSIKEEVVKSNKGYFMDRARALIADGKRNAMTKGFRDNAQNN